MEPILKEIYDAIIDANQNVTAEKVKQALDSGFPAGKILNEGMVPAMTEVGRLFEEGEYFVPEMLICARAMQAGMVVLKPSMVAGGVQPVGKVVAGTVKGDLHDIGKNLVCMMLRGRLSRSSTLGRTCRRTNSWKRSKPPGRT
jgi:5-methyltetrahydrofolate--homocysteine methyltransferase